MHCTTALLCTPHSPACFIFPCTSHSRQLLTLIPPRKAKSIKPTESIQTVTLHLPTALFLLFFFSVLEGLLCTNTKLADSPSLNYRWLGTTPNVRPAPPSLPSPLRGQPGPFITTLPRIETATYLATPGCWYVRLQHLSAKTDLAWTDAEITRPRRHYIRRPFP